MRDASKFKLPPPPNGGGVFDDDDDDEDCTQVQQVPGPDVLTAQEERPLHLMKTCRRSRNTSRSGSSGRGKTESPEKACKAVVFADADGSQAAWFHGCQW